VTDLLDGLARYLADRGLVDYQPNGAGGDCYLESMPQTPDEVVVLTLYGGDVDPLNPNDQPRLQVRARGTPDRRVSRGRVQAIYDQLHGETHLTLPDSTYLISARARQTVASMGIDDNGRHEHVTNFDLDVAAPSVNRP
jgi:hypothetical protein